MPPGFSPPGIYVEEVPSSVRGITGVATSIALFIGWAARGPLDRAVRIRNFSDYERWFGGLDRRTWLGHSVRQFFDNGGSDAHVLRLASSGTEGTGDHVAFATAGSHGLTVRASSPGAWANGLRVRVTQLARPAGAGASSRFRLEILDKPGESLVGEVFEDLSMDSNDARHAPDMVNGHSRFVDVHADGEPPPDATELTLEGGADGQVRGANDDAFRAALLESFDPGGPIDRIDLFNLVCVPGLTEAGTLRSLQSRCRERRAFLIADSPQGETIEHMVLGGIDGLAGTDASHSALYYPWIRASDPLQPGLVRTFPPCGFMAGVYARTDATRGVWKAPAGTGAGINGAVSPEMAMSDAENGRLNPLGINCLRLLPTHGTVAWGARTLDGHDARSSEWKYVPVRRMALFLEESLSRGTQWLASEPNDEPTWAQVRRDVGAFLHDLFRRGAFQGRSPSEAYFVKCDGETTSEADVRRRIVNLHVGFAPLKPAEFVVIRLQRTAGDGPTRAAGTATSLANARRADPYRIFRFRLKWEGRYVAGASKCSMPRSEAAVNREAADTDMSRKPPGVRKYEPITLERGVTHDAEFDHWASGNGAGGPRPGDEPSPADRLRDLVLEIYDEAGQLAFAYRLNRCRVAGYQSLPDLEANANAVAIQMLRLEHEGWD